MTLPHEDEIVEQSGGPWLGIAIIIAVIGFDCALHRREKLLAELV